MASASEPSGGRLFLIGGNEDPDEKHMTLLPHLVEMAGGKRARVLVCSSASEDPEEKARTYARLFKKIGVAEVVEAPVAERTAAEDPELVKAAERATAVFFTGGDQLRMTALVAGTPFSQVVRDRLEKNGLIVAGTSAGAAAVGSVMIIAGPSDGSVRRSDVTLTPGLGYWDDAVVDTHFNERGRVHRLITIFAHNPQVIGVGLDENTAIELRPGQRFTVFGAGVVMVFDGRVSHSNAPERAADEAIAVTDCTVHVLTEGYGFDMRTKRPLLPSGEEIPASGTGGAPV